MMRSRLTIRGSMLIVAGIAGVLASFRMFGPTRMVWLLILLTAGLMACLAVKGRPWLAPVVYLGLVIPIDVMIWGYCLMMMMQPSGRTFPILLMVTVFLCQVAGFLTQPVLRNRTQSALRAFLAVALLLNMVIWGLCTYVVQDAGLVLSLITMATAFPIMIGCGWAWWMADSSRIAARRLKWQRILVGGLVINPVVMLVLGWPLHLGFVVSSPAMERLANRVAAGEAVTLPQWAGIYRVVAVARDSQAHANVALIIDNNPSGRSGFVRLVEPDPTRIGVMYNLNFDIPMGGVWRYQNED